MAAVILQPICLMQDTHCVGLPTDGKQWSFQAARQRDKATIEKLDKPGGS
ncbi:MAG TPA: hypothetical protein VE604_04035 [Candidatus Polarisedimenticolia bacterium]|nr:hypothetical protein [Candidatus Polarisedimenticolia bacterium]